MMNKHNIQLTTAEITSREENPHRHLFVATCDGNKIGFGVCLDLAGESESEYVEEQYPDLSEKQRWEKRMNLVFNAGRKIKVA